MSNTNQSITIFISYCHRDKSIAEKIDKDLNRIGISIIRDYHELKYTDSISEFMHKIRRADFALLLISDDYLKSKNCLYEVGQLLKEENVWKKILPVIADKTNIYDAASRIYYIKYWQDQEKKLKNLLSDVDIINALPSFNELKTIGTYAGFIDEFLSKIVDMLHVDFQTLVENQYRPLFSKIGVDDITYLVELINISKIDNLRIKDIALEEYQNKFGVNTYLFCMKGKLESDLGRIDKARYYYNKSLEYDSNNTDALNNLGFLFHYFFNDLVEAEKLYKKALNINPDFITTLLNLGVLYRNTERVDLAIICFKKVLKLDSTNCKAHQNLANIYSIEKLDLEKAEMHYKKAMKYDSTNIEVLIWYANFLKVHRKKIEEGNRLYKKAKSYDKAGKYTTFIDTMLKSHKG